MCIILYFPNKCVAHVIPHYLLSSLLNNSAVHRRRRDCRALLLNTTLTYTCTALYLDTYIRIYCANMPTTKVKGKKKGKGKIVF